MGRRQRFATAAISYLRISGHLPVCHPIYIRSGQILRPRLFATVPPSTEPEQISATAVICQFTTKFVYNLSRFLQRFCNSGNLPGCYQICKRSGQVSATAAICQFTPKLCGIRAVFRNHGHLKVVSNTNPISKEEHHIPGLGYQVAA